ncbi:MAG: hypothetical protein U0Z26_16575 [Anaerolineales bacterium]
MKESKSDPELSVSPHKRRKTVEISTSMKDGHILVIRQYTDYSIFLFISAILIGFSVLTFLFLKMPLTYAYILVFLIAAHFLFKDRPVNCVVDKQRGQIDYFREGLLGFSFFEQNIHCSVSEIKQLNMKRYESRIGDTYKIILVLNDGQKLPLSSNKLRSNDCKSFANKLCAFLEHDIPIEGSD